jgi:hypothetical protein
MMSLGNVVTIMGRVGSFAAPRLPGVIRAVIGVDGKGGIISLIAEQARDVIISEFINTSFEVANERIGGTKIHSRLEKLIKDNFGGRQGPFAGWYIYIEPEVFFDKNGKAPRRGKGSLGVDVLFYVNRNKHGYDDKDAKIILDFKTGKGWSSSHMRRLRERFGHDVTIIQMFLPIKYKK